MNRRMRSIKRVICMLLGIVILTQGVVGSPQPVSAALKKSWQSRLDKYADKFYYNQFVDIRKQKHVCTGGEHLIDYKGSYNYCLSINYNRSCTYKKGSAIFLHCIRPGATSTAGCVAIPEKYMKKIIRTVTKGARICIYPM